VQHDGEAPNLERILAVLRRRLPLIVLCAVLVAVAAFFFSMRQTKEYTATSSLVFSNDSLSQQIAGLSASTGTTSSELAAQANNLELVSGGNAAAKTAKSLGHGITTARVVGSLSISGQAESGIVQIAATTTSPTLAAEIANTYAQQFVKEQQNANSAYFKSALALVHKQLLRLTPSQRTGADGLQLQNRAQTFALLKELDYGNVSVAQQAVPPSSPSSPRTKRNTALGLFLGLLIGVGLAIGLERLDRRIKGPEDLEAIYRLPVLGTVPETQALARPSSDGQGRQTALPPADAEAFNLIRGHIRSFNLDREPRTIAIASAEPRDGKTTVARHLAEAAARLGSRALLIEADLRHPALSSLLGLPPGPGLADVLNGAVSSAQAIRRMEFAPSAPSGNPEARTLDVLPAGGALPPNPAALLESPAMDGLLEQTRLAYDLVVIDTPPLTVVSDALGLLTKVDGVVIVGRVAQSHRDAAERLHLVLRGSGAPLLGLIVNGSKSGVLPSYVRSSGHEAAPVYASSNGTAPADAGELPSTTEV
jgi:succinoglycan biosynthesis transport protein ExoP